MEVFQVQDFRCNAKKHALAEAPKEACGVLVNDSYFPCNNIADQPDNDFVLDPKDYLKARMKGKIQAVIHSHPKGGKASQADHKACSQLRLPWHIYLIPQDKWLTINP